MDYQAPRGAIWAAELFAGALDLVGKFFDKIRSASWSPPQSLDACKNAEDVIAYANSIRFSQPTFASELLAAAGRDQTK